MQPQEYIRLTREHYAAYPPYQWTVNTDVPWTPLRRPMAECRVVLIGSGGIFHKDQPPFRNARDDLSFREIARDANAADLRIVHYAYDKTSARQDINVVFPYQRLADLEREKVIGELAPSALAFMGALFRRTAAQQDLYPSMVQRVQALRADLAFLVPV